MGQVRVSAHSFALYQKFHVRVVGRNNNLQAHQYHKTVLLTDQNYYLGFIHGYFTTIRWLKMNSCES